MAGGTEGQGGKQFVLTEGKYIGETIHDFRQRLPETGKTFQALLACSDYDKTNGKCIDKYLNDKDVICLIKKAVQKK